jgi:hypothetical protein
MKKKALIDNNNIVLNIAVFEDNFNEDGWNDWIEYTEENPAYIGGDYIDGYFYLPQPYLSWTRDKGMWVPPVPMPENGMFQWNEEEKKWEQINIT